MGGSSGRRRASAAVAAAAVAAAVAGCRADASVAVTESAGGPGTVAVTVTVDGAADRALGGLGAAVDTTGLAAAGWAVGPPQPTAGGGEAVTATHPFTDPAQASAVLAGVAGPGVARLAITRHAGLFSTRTAARGVLDLSCGLACFGDAGLRAATGSVVGVDPAALSSSTGATAAAALHVAMTVTIPGARAVTVHPPLGTSAPIDVAATATNTAAVLAVAAAAAAVVAAGVGAWLLLRRRRRRGGGGGRHARGRGATVAAVPDPVTPGP